MGQYDQMLASLEAQYQAQRKQAEAQAQADLVKLQVNLQQKQEQAAAAEQQAEDVQTQTGTEAWRSMLIDRNPFGAKAERGQNGGLAEYYQGAAYDAYRAALRNAVAQRQAERLDNEKLMQDASLSYAMNEAEVQRTKEATLAKLEADYNMQRQQILLEQAAYEQQAQIRKKSNRKSKNQRQYTQSTKDTRIATGTISALGGVTSAYKKSKSEIDALLR